MKEQRRSIRYSIQTVLVELRVPLSNRKALSMKQLYENQATLRA